MRLSQSAECQSTVSLLCDATDGRLTAVRGERARQRRPVTVRREDDDRELYVSSGSEALLETWPSLRDWVAGSRAELLARQQADEAAAAWHAHGRRDGDLWSGPRMAIASRYLDSGGDVVLLDRVSREFLAASTERGRRASHLALQRRRSIVAGACALLLVAAGGIRLANGTSGSPPGGQSIVLRFGDDARKLAALNPNGSAHERASQNMCSAIKSLAADAQAFLLPPDTLTAQSWSAAIGEASSGAGECIAGLFKHDSSPVTSGIAEIYDADHTFLYVSIQVKEYVNARTSVRPTAHE